MAEIDGNMRMDVGTLRDDLYVVEEGASDLLYFSDALDDSDGLGDILDNLLNEVEHTRRELQDWLGRHRA